jgi:hypothetical protein
MKAAVVRGSVLAATALLVAGRIATYLRTFPAPPGLGAITLTQIVGSTVRYTTATGGSGSFEVTAGVFGP